MIFFVRALVALIVAAAGVRTALIAVYQAWEVPDRLAVYFTEPQSVYLAHRVQLGESLYPEWRSFPYVVNVFTPGYFWAVGLIGRAMNANVEVLQWLGRGVTMLCAVIGAALIAFAMRRYGRAAMAAAAGCAIGSGFLLGFGWMARPDMAADMFGFAGFLTATAPTSAGLAIALLTAGMLCKQTSVLYLIAAAAALVWQKRRGRAGVVFAGSIIVTLLVLGVAFATGEPRIFADIVLEAGTPWRWEHWQTIAQRCFIRAGDELLIGIIGVVLWTRQLQRGDSEEAQEAKRWLALLAAAAIFGGVGAAKIGSDVNYYLPLRYVAAAALGGLVGGMRNVSASMSTSDAAIRRPHATWNIVGAVMALLAVADWGLTMRALLSQHPTRDPNKERLREAYSREVQALTRLSQTQPVFTNCDDLALRIDNPFADSFLFKMLADTGRLDPKALIERLRRGEYHTVATLGAVEDPSYVESPFGLPTAVAAAILERYERKSRGVFYYYRLKTGAGY